VGVLSESGYSCPFDEDADGMGRAEGYVTFLWTLRTLTIHYHLSTYPACTNIVDTLVLMRPHAGVGCSGGAVWSFAVWGTQSETAIASSPHWPMPQRARLDPSKVIDIRTLIM
jgi:hypothetical protein